MEVEAGAAEEVGGVGANVRAAHCAVYKGVGQEVFGYIVESVVWGGGDVVEDADGPGWAAEADPVDDVAGVPCWEGVDAFVPVRPDVLFGGDGLVVGEGGEDVGVGAGVEGSDVL